MCIRDRLRLQSRLSAIQGRVHFGGALSGRDTNAVNKTVSGLLKLLYPGDESEIPDEDIEWSVRLAMESRRRVKEQQKRIGAAEFRNTHFSYIMGTEGIEKYVSTPEPVSYTHLDVYKRQLIHSDRKSLTNPKWSVNISFPILGTSHPGK